MLKNELKNMRICNNNLIKDKNNNERCIDSLKNELKEFKCTKDDNLNQENSVYSQIKNEYDDLKEKYENLQKIYKNEKNELENINQSTKSKLKNEIINKANLLKDKNVNEKCINSLKEEIEKLKINDKSPD